MILLTQTEVAARFQVRPRTLEQWRYLGQGPTYTKVGRCVRYAEADLEAWVESRRRQAINQDKKETGR